ncbi:MAG: helix-turn-helix domain-containing protein [Bacteroidales bacterium]|nr:helix-turn-helix domain-containing protein [Bacteroidales bacterium]
MVRTRTISVLNRMDSMIRLRSTGNPADFAERLSISERTLYNYLALMKDLGAPVRYSRTRESYFYQVNGRFVFEFEKQTELNYAV